MATTSQLKQTLYDELVDIITELFLEEDEFSDQWQEDAFSETEFGEDAFAYNFVGDLNDHARIANKGEEGPLPTLTFETFESRIPRGFDGDIHTHDLVYDDSGTLVKVIFRRDKLMTVDIAAHAPNSDEELKDSVYESVEDRFVNYTEAMGDPTDLHDDVADVTLHGTQDVSQPDDAVRGERLRIEVEYHRFFERDVTAIQTVNGTIEVGDIGEDVEEETFDGEVTAEYDS